MSERFIKFIPNEQADFLRERHTALFLLLSLAVQRVHWHIEPSDLGLLQGDAILGSSKKAGITPKQYTLAIVKGEELGIWKVVYSKKRLGQSKDNQRMIKGTINSIVVNIINPMCWDLNFQDQDNRQDNQKTIKRQYTKKQQEVKEYIHKENNNKDTSSVQNVVVVFINQLPLSENDKAALIKDEPSLERMKLAWEYSQKVEIQTSVIQCLRWHLKQKTPPKQNENFLSVLNRTFKNNEKYNGAICYLDKDLIAFERGTVNIPIKFNERDFKKKIIKTLNHFGIKHEFEMA